MCKTETPVCLDCENDLLLSTNTVHNSTCENLGDANELPSSPSGRRDFIKRIGGGAAALVAVSAAPTFAQKPTVSTKKAKPAEDMIRELHGTLSADQKKKLVLPWNHGGGNGKKLPTRFGMYNRPLNNQRIADNYTKPQAELLERILKSICNGDKGFHAVSRAGKWDNSKTFDGCGAHIFGDPNGKFTWLFTGHHLTMRCDGDSEPGAAFGGPLYYGHLKRGYSKSNVFNFQTRAAQSVFEALDGGQRKLAVLEGTPGEHAKSIALGGKNKKKPGIAYAKLSADQKTLVGKVMADLLSLYRKEDGDEVMNVIKATGGMDKIHMAFYKDEAHDPEEPWSFWRLEGPGFVWNYRVVPHVHCFVNISSKIG